MTGPADMVLAETVLAAHLGVIAFNIAGLIAIPIGAWLGWRFARLPWLRILHLASLAAVAGQAVAGRACFLTIMQDDLTGQGAAHTPLIMGFVNQIIFWPLPMWVFTAACVLVLIYAIALLKLAPLRRRRRLRG